MSEIIFDPHARGYQYEPKFAVTAEFSTGVDVEALQRALAAAGFAADAIHVLKGPAGADRLDPHGDRHGTWVHFRRALERATADESVFFDRVEKLLRSGGVVAAAFTDGDSTRKAQAAEILMACGGQDVLYWGRWTVDRI